MMLDKNDDSFKKFAEDFGKFKEMIHRHDMEHKDEILIEQGREEERAESIKSMHKLNVPLEQISLYLNIPLEEVKRFIE